MVLNMSVFLLGHQSLVMVISNALKVWCVFWDGVIYGFDFVFWVFMEDTSSSNDGFGSRVGV